MRLTVPVLAILALCFASAQAQAAGSCSSFAVIKSYDAAKQLVEVDWEKGKMDKFFPKPEGTPRDSMKVAKPCRSRTKKVNTLHVKPTGGRMSVTQIRSNFEGKMLNELENESWLPNHLQKLIADKTEVVIVVRPSMSNEDELNLTTVYLPITDEEKAEIKRIEEQAEDV